MSNKTHNLFCGDIEDIDWRKSNGAGKPAEVEKNAESHKLETNLELNFGFFFSIYLAVKCKMPQFPLFLWSFLGK